MGGIFVGTVLAFFVAVVCGEPGVSTAMLSLVDINQIADLNA